MPKDLPPLPRVIVHAPGKATPKPDPVLTRRREADAAFELLRISIDDSRLMRDYLADPSKPESADPLKLIGDLFVKAIEQYRICVTLPPPPANSDAPLCFHRIASHIRGILYDYETANPEKPR